MEEILKYLLNYGVGVAFAIYLLVKTTPAIEALKSAVAENTAVLQLLAERLRRREERDERDDLERERRGRGRRQEDWMDEVRAREVTGG